MLPTSIHTACAWRHSALLTVMRCHRLCDGCAISSNNRGGRRLSALSGCDGCNEGLLSRNRFDMTLGMAAGPYGSPDRFGGNKNITSGGWERTISTHHSIVSLVTEARSWLPDPIGGTLWFAPHAAHTSVYAPFPCGMDLLPESYANGSEWGPVNKGIAAWANRAIFGAAQARFNDAIVLIESTRSTLDNASFAMQASTDAAYKAGIMDMQRVGELFRENADAIVASWWVLHDQLIHTSNVDSGYPEWWLQSADVNYINGPASASASLEGGTKEDARECIKSRCKTVGDDVDLACVMRCLN